MTADPASLALRALRAWMSRCDLARALARGRRAGGLLEHLIRYHRRDAFDALRRAFPGEPETRIRRIVRDMYEHLGMTLAESLRLLDEPIGQIKARIEWRGIEILERERASGRGVCLLTAHAGNWELACAVLPLFGLPVTIVAKPIRGRALAEYVRGVRTRFGLQVLPSRNSYRDCLRALRRNDLLGFVLDQNMTRYEGVFVDFFGRPACTTPGLAHIAARSGARIVPAFAERREDGRHVIHVHPPLDPPPDTEPETLRAATQEYTKRIEDHVRAFPDQWIWIHRRWRTVPRPDDPQPGRPVPIPTP